jgi:hypothetical protein
LIILKENNQTENREQVLHTALRAKESAVNVNGKKYSSNL